jgi:hypothetical protein
MHMQTRTHTMLALLPTEIARLDKVAVIRKLGCRMPTAGLFQYRHRKH